MKIHAAFVFFVFLTGTVFFNFASAFSHQSFDSDIIELSQSPAWKNIFFPDSKGRSRSDAKYFFISNSRHPKDELSEAIKRLLAESGLPTDDSFICQFPLRTKRISQVLLKKNFKFETILEHLKNNSLCPKLREWQKRVPSKSASLIFSSYYLGNPSSTFGHTFLRLNKHENSEGTELLDQGINFGANATTDNPLYYAIGGLFGAFNSNFIALPYYYKVREYNDYEARDLWEYRLNLTSEEVEDLVLALWEQKDNFYDYYFLTENCGYYMLALIEAAAPRYQLTPGLRHWVIPADTLVIGQQQNLFTSVNFRPSLKIQLVHRIKRLSSEERKVYDSSLQEILKIQPQDLPDAETQISKTSLFTLEGGAQARVLDALMDGFDIQNKHLYLEDQSKGISKAALTKKALLFKRSELPTSPPLLIEKNSDRDPSKSHGSFRWGVGFKSEQGIDTKWQRNSLLTSFRMAYHDWLDQEMGAPQGASIEIFKTEFSVSLRDDNDDSAFMVESFYPFSIASIPFFADQQWSPSWMLKLGMEKMTDQFAQNDLRPVVNGGYGFGPLLLKAELETSVKFPTDNYLLKLGPALIYRFKFSDKWLSLLQAEYPLWAGNFQNSENASKLHKLNFITRWHLNGQKSLEFGVSKTALENQISFNYYSLSF